MTICRNDFVNNIFLSKIFHYLYYSFSIECTYSFTSIKIELTPYPLDSHFRTFKPNFAFNYLALSVPDDGYSRNASHYVFMLIKVWQFWGLPPMREVMNWRWLYSEKSVTSLDALTYMWSVMLYLVHLSWLGFELAMLVVIGTEAIINNKAIINQPYS